MNPSLPFPRRALASFLPSFLRRCFGGLLLLLSAALASGADPSGVWKIHLETPNGRALDSTLTLTLKNGKLTGTMDNRAGKADISAASFADDQVSFKVEREFGRFLKKKTIVTHYQAKLEGDTLKGTIETTGRDDQPKSVPFEAVRN